MSGDLTSKLRKYEASTNRRGLLLGGALSLLMACITVESTASGGEDGKLPPCPASPNCVSSDATDSSHRVEPYRLRVAPGDGWQVLLAVVAALPRTTVVTKTGDSLHVEVRSALFGFVDDVEFQLRPADKTIAVRSASRVGYWDLGVNRRRVEQIRELLRAKGVVG
ncbi:MAG: DUF1499 domain-containing protein [Candidatus Competibacteraceae bacterium]